MWQNAYGKVPYGEHVVAVLSSPFADIDMRDMLDRRRAPQARARSEARAPRRRSVQDETYLR